MSFAIRHGCDRKRNQNGYVPRGSPSTHVPRYHGHGTCGKALGSQEFITSEPTLVFLGDTYRC